MIIFRSAGGYGSWIDNDRLSKLEVMAQMPTITKHTLNADCGMMLSEMTDYPPI